MQKTKLGISIGFMGAILCCAGMFMGYTATLLLAGYIILMEDDVWLKATAVKVVSIMTVFSLIIATLSIIPDAIGLLNYFVALFGGSFSVLFLTNLTYFLQQMVSLAETVVFLMLALKALKMDMINVPVVDNLITQHMD